MGELGPGEAVLAPSSGQPRRVRRWSCLLRVVSECATLVFGLLRQAQSGVIVVRLLSNSRTVAYKRTMNKEGE